MAVLIFFIFLFSLFSSFIFSMGLMISFMLGLIFSDMDLGVRLIIGVLISSVASKIAFTVVKAAIDELDDPLMNIQRLMNKEMSKRE